MILAHIKGSLAGHKWLAFFGIAALMTNTGYSNNLLQALGCEQYYLEYLLFFVLVYGAKIIADRFLCPLSVRSVITKGVTSGLLIAGLFFVILAAYNWLTNCPFDPVLFATTRLPLILLLSGWYQYSRYTKHGNGPESTPSPMVHLKRLDGVNTLVDTSELRHIQLKDGLLRVCTRSGNKWVVDGTLKSVFDQLNAPDQFYRVNRSAIVHRESILNYTVNDKHQLEVMLHNETTVLINKNKAKAFKDWLGRFPL